MQYIMYITLVILHVHLYLGDKSLPCKDILFRVETGYFSTLANLEQYVHLPSLVLTLNFCYFQYFQLVRRR